MFCSLGSTGIQGLAGEGRSLRIGPVGGGTKVGLARMVIQTGLSKNCIWYPETN